MAIFAPQLLIKKSKEMNLKHFAQSSSPLNQILSQTSKWQSLNLLIQQYLPPHLRPHIHVACLRDQTLIIHTDHNTTASRLKMMAPMLLDHLSSHHGDIQSIVVKMSPTQPERTRKKKSQFGLGAQEACSQAADQLNHHPELATALRALVKNNVAD